MRKIKKGDTVVVIAGKNKGREGVVLAVLKSKGKDESSLRVLVEGINVVKRHTKGNPSAEKPSSIVEKELPIAISNVAILNKETGKADRVGIKVLEDGRKARIFKSTGEMVGS